MVSTAIMPGMNTGYLAGQTEFKKAIKKHGKRDDSDSNVEHNTIDGFEDSLLSDITTSPALRDTGKFKENPCRPRSNIIWTTEHVPGKKKMERCEHSA
eukprot:1065963-Ditylum_brightwellii.AAC.1